MGGCLIDFNTLDGKSTCLNICKCYEIGDKTEVDREGFKNTISTYKEFIPDLSAYGADGKAEFVPVAALTLYTMAQNMKKVENPGEKILSFILTLGFIAAAICILIVLKERRDGKKQHCLFTDDEGQYSSAYRLLTN